ncbi:unnamed protein product [Symbiodinium natans]|uniref:Reverse transcriptase domain-containing protein n=1 Tax=Symbiodinium natans TaxID=878477 RepID=A0A812U175_9DINO|nr:unnamed protein product [Symbiodinium natans]
MQHVQQPPQAVVNAPVPALQNQLPAAPVAQDVEMDPLLADINRLISSLSLEPMLPLTKVEFTDVPVDLVNLMVRQDDFISSGSFKELVPDFIERAIKVYHGECDALHKALHTLKLDAALYAQGKWPRPLQHKSDDQKAMEDFKRKIEASKQWVSLKAKDLDTMNFISTKLGELYDKLLENQMRVDKNDMQKMRAHVVCVLHAQLPEHMHKAAKKYADRSKDKADSDKKRLDREQKFDELLQMYPKVALAVFFREMEERLISVCLARKEQMEQEYRRVRRGQQLTTLEDHVYNMKADLQKNGFAHLDSRMTQIFQQSKSKVKGNKVGSGSRGMQTEPAKSNENQISNFENIAAKRKDIFYERAIQRAAASFRQPKLKIKAVAKFREIYDQPTEELQPQHLPQQEQSFQAGQQMQQPKQNKPRDLYMNIRNLRRCHFGNKRRGHQCKSTTHVQHESPRNLTALFFEYVQQLTLVDLVLIRKFISLHQTDVDPETFPPAAQTLLILGDKFIPMAQCSRHSLRDSLQDLVRKVKLRLFFDNRPKKQKNQDTFFKSFRLPSRFIPKLDAEIEQELESWSEGLLSKACRLMHLQPKPTTPFFIQKALVWLKENRHFVCKIPADKGYGPAYISTGRLREQYLRETADGAFTKISSSQLMWSLIAAYDQLQAICDSAIQNRLIDVGTMRFILQPLRELGFPNPRKDVLPDVLSCVGKIRYLVKLHKPGCKLRRVEVDTRSPFNNLTLFVSSILRQVVTVCQTTVLDSKQVLLDLLDQPPPLSLEPNSVVFVAADLQDFYPRINLDSLQVSLRSGLDAYYGVNEAAKNFVAKLVFIILHNKAVLINGSLYRKARSLSIGERIATDAANIHREHHFGPLVREAFQTGLLCKYYGYVDDTASIFRGSLESTQAFLTALQNVDPVQFSWTFSISRSQLDFLDLSIRFDGRQLHTFVHKKPHHNPQYLHAYSEHPLHCRKHIFRSQVARFLVLNSTERGFLDDVSSLRQQLAKRLHPESWFSQAKYDVDRRTSLLNKLRARCFKSGSHGHAMPTVSPIVCKLEYSEEAKRLGLQTAWNKLKAKLARFHAFEESTLPEAKLTVAWKCSFSLFRQTYRYNFVPG